MKIDVFSHINPVKYVRALRAACTSNPDVLERLSKEQTSLTNLDLRFEIMDKFDGYAQVLTLASPPIEKIAGPEKAVDLAKIANDEMAELVAKHPDRFVSATASLPMNNMDAAMKELDRAIGELKLGGIQIYSPVNDKPLDNPEFLTLFEKMSLYDLPIWIHPWREPDHSDYRTEEKSFYHLFGLLGWTFETTMAMARLTFSGIMEKFPDIKIITHHCGGTIPYLAGRIAELGEEGNTDSPRFARLKKTPLDYLKVFYGDTATYGVVSALMCGYDFFGAERLLFGSDMPLGSFSEPGVSGTTMAITGIEQMNISEAEKKMIFEYNIRRLLHLS